jgi:hypothetical protein
MLTLGQLVYGDVRVILMARLLRLGLPSPSITLTRVLANDSALMERRATAHSSCCSASTAPTGG